MNKDVVHYTANRLSTKIIWEICFKYFNRIFEYDLALY
jgi:hypothetical protein